MGRQSLHKACLYVKTFRGSKLTTTKSKSRKKPVAKSREFKLIMIDKVKCIL